MAQTTLSGQNALLSELDVSLVRTLGVDSSDGPVSFQLPLQLKVGFLPLIQARRRVYKKAKKKSIFLRNKNMRNHAMLSTKMLICTTRLKSMQTYKSQKQQQHSP